MKLDEKVLELNYKFGILFCKQGQSLESQMFANEHGSPHFSSFLKCIGQRVTLKGYRGFRGGLDVVKDSTGTESFVATLRKNVQIMFHVSTLLPFSSQTKQQISRKAHIGNDVGLIIFREGGSKSVPFNPKSIVSQFPHFFIVVETVPESGDSPLKVRIGCVRREDVPGTIHGVQITCFHII